MTRAVLVASPGSVTVKGWSLLARLTAVSKAGQAQEKDGRQHPHWRRRPFPSQLVRKETRHAQRPTRA